MLEVGDTWIMALFGDEGESDCDEKIYLSVSCVDTHVIARSHIGLSGIDDKTPTLTEHFASSLVPVLVSFGGRHRHIFLLILGYLQPLKDCSRGEHPVT
jgi:hypothetical protein